jgi:hypothetical protein
MSEDVRLRAITERIEGWPAAEALALEMLGALEAGDKVRRDNGEDVTKEYASKHREIARALTTSP